MAPLVVASTALLSARTAVYLVGFTLGSIGAGWLLIIATLVAVTGLFGTTSNTAECEAYRAQVSRVDAANRAAFAAYFQQFKSYADGPYRQWAAAQDEHNSRVNGSINAQNQLNQQQYQSTVVAGLSPVQKTCAADTGGSCTNQYGSPNQCSSIPACVKCRFPCPPAIISQVPYSVPAPSPPPSPQLQTYPACSSPNCPAGKKTWLQVVWGSPKGNFSDAKGCFIVAYSQDAPTIPVKIEYNPFLPELFVRSRATSYYLIQGDRFRGVNTSDWKNLESVSGWDKGYWKSETTDPECRGWNPGWSRKVK